MRNFFSNLLHTVFFILLCVSILCSCANGAKPFFDSDIWSESTNCKITYLGEEYNALILKKGQTVTVDFTYPESISGYTLTVTDEGVTMSYNDLETEVSDFDLAGDLTSMIYASEDSLIDVSTDNISGIEVTVLTFSDDMCIYTDKSGLPLKYTCGQTVLEIIHS